MRPKNSKSVSREERQHRKKGALSYSNFWELSRIIDDYFQYENINFIWMFRFSE